MRVLHTLRMVALVGVIAVGLVFVTPSAAQVEEGVWLAEYFEGTELQGEALSTETYPGPFLNLTWEPDSQPVWNVPAVGWSARFSTLYTFPGGNVKFLLKANDGARLYVNQQLIIDSSDFFISGGEFISRVLPVPAGTYLVQVEYLETGGDRYVVAEFPDTTDEPSADDQNFTFPGISGGEPAGGEGAADDTGGGATPAPGGGGTAGQLPPGILIDESDHFSFVWNGFESWGFATGGFYNNAFAYTDNEETSYSMWGRWNVNIPRPGEWDVYAYIPDQSGATTNARYRVFASGMLSDEIVVDQSAHRGQWVWLGTFTFTTFDPQYLYLNDLTFEQEGTHLVLYDTARFVERDN
jgi:hypothetical protein